MPATGRRPPSRRLAQGAMTKAPEKLPFGSAPSGNGASTSRPRQASVAQAPPPSGIRLADQSPPASASKRSVQREGIARGRLAAGVLDRTIAATLVALLH